MSNLNRAFIKAYGKSTGTNDASEPAAAPVSKSTDEPRIDPPQTTPESPSVVVGNRVTLSELASSPNPVVAETTAPPAVIAGTIGVKREVKHLTIVDRAHTSVKPPHVDLTKRTAKAPRETERKLTPTPAAPPPTEKPAADTRPHLLPLAAAQPWRPVFELSNFVWPRITIEMLDSFAGRFRDAAFDLIDAARKHRKLIAIVGSSVGAGCTAVTLALARALAQQQQRVALVDANFSAPALADSLGVGAQVGWEENLSGEKPLTEALVESLDDHMTLLPLKQPAAAEWRVGDARLKATFDELRKHFDLVLVDAGTLGDKTDRRRLLSWGAPCRVDRALIVRDHRLRDDQENSRIDDQLRSCGIAQWNFVDNFTAA